MVQDGPGSISREVEETVMGKVAQGGGIRHRLVFHLEGFLRRKGVAQFDVQIAGPAFCPVRIFKQELYGVRTHFPHGPRHPVDAREPAVQGIAVVVGAEPVLPAVQGESRSADAVGHTTDGSAEKALPGAVLIFPEAGIAYDDIGHGAVLSGDLQRKDSGAVVGDGHLQATTPYSIDCRIHSLTSSF